MIRPQGIFKFDSFNFLGVKHFGLKRVARPNWRKRHRKNVIWAMTRKQSSRNLAIFIYNKNYKR